MAVSANLETIVSHGLCAGCGLCESLTGSDKVEMRITAYGQMRPQVKLALDDTLMDTILDVCPGIKVTGPVQAQLDDHGVMHDIWGPIRSISRGWSTDAALRFYSAAGGAMTASACYLLETGRIDAVVHVRDSLTSPMETDALVSRNLEEVRSGAQSRYGPAAPLRYVRQLLDEGINFAVFGKPCDVAAIRDLAKVDLRVESQVPYLISNFCGGVPSRHTASKIASYHGLEVDDIKVFRWRGKGWPGPTHIETQDGDIYELSYEQTWLSDDKPWTYDLQFRCKICPDAISELADVSCPDAWLMLNGKPTHEEAPGANLFIARTAVGEELVTAAIADGAIEVETFTIDELDLQHAERIERKLENPARVRALEIEGELSPSFTGFRRSRMVEMAGPERDKQAEEGTRQRIRKYANREPLS